jgi:hypothetical protein
MPATMERAPAKALGDVYCPICTHTVQADVEWVGKKIRVSPGQKCARCAAPLDAGAVVYIPKAA